MATFEWRPRLRDYEKERKTTALPREETFDYPLRPIIVTLSEGRLKRPVKSGASSASSSAPATPKKLPLNNPLSSGLDGSDPLSMFAAESDPLSRIAAEMTLHERKESTSKKAKGPELDLSFEPWSSKKAAILNKYTTSEKLSIATSFLSGGEKVVIKTQSTVTDKMKNRLEQLDDFEEGSVKEMLNLSQQEYVIRIDELNQALIVAWDQDQKVKALKIAIQCAKLLADINVIQFYPSKFVLITDILDTFGRLVYERIHSKAQYTSPGSNVPAELPENFTADQVPASAKETCRNWFFKIASIRELIPRLYMETCILKCYSFLTSGEYSQALTRLSLMIRGIGDPLVGVYARCYLCRVGMAVAPHVREHLISQFTDFLLTYPQLQGDNVQNILAFQKLEMPTYLTLYSPALDWILQSIAHRAPESTLMELLDKCKKQCNSALLLNSIMAAFRPEYIASRALQFVDMIKESEDSGFPKHLLFRTLGLCLVVAVPPENQKLQILNDVWKVVMKLKDPASYMSCAEVWIEYPVRHFSEREVNTIIGDIIKHMTPDRAFENHYAQLQLIVDRILSHLHDFGTVFSMDKFLPFLDMFQKESVKVDVCKSIMDSFVRYQTEATNDPVITNALMFICKTMHDSINALTLEDEKRQISLLICGFLRIISFGRDFEQQLSFFVEARAIFNNLEPVLAQLIQNVNVLAMETRIVVKGHHTRKTAAFVRACAAYCFITIPSLTGIFPRLLLYLHSGQVALLNQCLSQADALFKAAISLIPEVPRSIEIDNKMRSTEPLLVEFISNFMSTLLVAPDHPDQGVLYLVRGLLNILQEYIWESNSDAKVKAYLNVLNFLAAVSQETFTYHVDKIDSNDALYGSDIKFLAEVDKISDTILEEILQCLKALGESEAYKRQSLLALDLCGHIVAHGDLSNNSMFTLVCNLWNLSQKHGQANGKKTMALLHCLRTKGCQPGGKVYSNLASRLSAKT